MNTTDPEYELRATAVRTTTEALVVDLEDGRTISVPLWWYPRLFNATPAQRERWEFNADGYGIHWPDVDEDISVWGLLHGGPVRGAQPPAETAEPAS